MTRTSELAGLYAQINDEELLDRYVRGGLDREAMNVIDAEMASRGLTAASIVEAQHRVAAAQPSRKIPTLAEKEKCFRLMRLCLLTACGSPIFVILVYFLLSKAGYELPTPPILMLLGPWALVVLGFYYFVYRTARALDYQPWVLLLIAVVFKLFGWFVVYWALKTELRRQRRSLPSRE